MRVVVEVYRSADSMFDGYDPIRHYTMNHDDQAERRVLGEQCRNAFEGGQCIVTYPEAD